MNRANADIRKAVTSSGFKLWELADALGINDGNLSRKLRTELPADEKEQLYVVIAKMKTRREEQGHGRN